MLLRQRVLRIIQATMQQISERDAALKLAEELADVPELAAMLRQLAIESVPQQNERGSDEAMSRVRT